MAGYLGRWVQGGSVSSITHRYPVPLFIRPPRISDLGYDTTTLENCWPWYKGVLFITAGCVLAGCEDLFGGPPEAPRRRQPLIDF